MSLESMKQRLTFHGGAAQQDRMIKDKLRSMLSATKYSYQAARFNKYPDYPKEWRGLFNRETQTQDYDTKMISIPWDSGYKVGDVFRWENTGTLWIIFLKELTELAYFRGHCRRCDWKVQWVNKDRQVCETPISVIGPTNPNLESINNGQAGASIDVPNGNLVVLVTDNDQNRAYFDRNQQFLLLGRTYQVEQIDPISMPGVIQINATEHYTNLIEDDVEENLINAWNVQPIITEHTTDYGIDGPLTIKPGQEVKYEAIVSGGYWVIMENEGPPNFPRPIPATFVELDTAQKVIHVKWTEMTSGSFTLGYKMPNGTIYQRHIIVESLF